MTAATHIDAPTLRAVVEQYRDTLRTHREELNRLNVYPVPDGDTGTNMVLTVESVLQELGGAQSMAEICKGLAHGSLMGARGNSGVILSQILRGLAGAFESHEVIDARGFTDGLTRASKAAYEAVMRPVEGTILTVVRESAEAAEQSCNGDETPLVDVLAATHTAATASLARTPELLPVLKEAGVVDAGGRGFVLLLDAALHVLAGRPLPEPQIVEATPAVVAAMSGEGDVSALRYEVMFLLEAEDEKVRWFKDAWAAIGDSIVVVGGDGLWNCHIHTDEIGGAVEAGIEAGRPRNIAITDLAEQVEEEAWVREQADVGGEGAAREPVETAVVAVAVGPGLQRLFTGLGCARVVAGGQTMNPSTQQILEAVEGCPSDAVVILPNNKNIVPVAQQVDALTEKRVEVVPTVSVVEGLSALISYDPHAPLDTNVAAISEGAQRVRAGEVTRAVRDAPSDAGAIREGDWIALDRSGIVAIAESAVEAAVHLIDRIADDDHELVTIVFGAQARADDTQRLKEQLALAHPDLEVEVHDGGQPLYPYVIGVE